jgi:hypothetical protein
LILPDNFPLNLWNFKFLSPLAGIYANESSLAINGNFEKLEASSMMGDAKWMFKGDRNLKFHKLSGKLSGNIK